MSRRAIAMVLIPAFLIAASGCTIYRNAPKTAVEIRSMPQEKRENMQISAARLYDGTEMKFVYFNLARWRDEGILGGVDASGVKVPYQKIAARQPSQAGKIVVLTLSEGSTYEVLQAWQVKEALHIVQGSRIEKIPFHRVESVQVREKDPGLTAIASLLAAGAAVIAFQGLAGLLNPMSKGWVINLRGAFTNRR